MGKVYKIHPGIGMARVAPSKSGYFITGEIPGAGPFEIDGDGNDVAFQGYKDSAKIMRRQGARFRVFEYDRDDESGDETLLREVTASEAEITWTVRLAATKAAQFTMDVEIVEGKKTIIPSEIRRNPDTDSSLLQSEIEIVATGKNYKPAEGDEPKGQILGKKIYIGEARTDIAGRLIVLPGYGYAYSWLKPDGQQPKLVDFYDNPCWYDDIADGSVDAVVKIGNADPIPALGSWIFTAPPDFAPDTQPLTTLYDIAQQSLNVPLPDPLTYPQDIEPLFSRAAGLFQTNSRPVWQAVQDLLNTSSGLNDNSPATAATRRSIVNAVLSAEGQMANYRLTKRQKDILRKYVDGLFQASSDPGRPPPSIADDLDRSSLDRSVGGGFLPGIEAGNTLRRPGIFATLPRLVRGTFQDHNGTEVQLTPGLISGRMACPWHADFVECYDNWWPSQRPDITGRTSTGAAKDEWARGIVVVDNATHESRLNMKEKFSQLGVVVANADGSFGEIGRDEALDTGV